jgi:Ead/Ea22-like protein
VKYDELRALALAATPGPWEIVTGPFTTCISSRSGFIVGSDGMASYGQDVINANYIAAANPATVLALLDDLARLRAAARAFCQERTEAALIALMSEVER